MKAVFTALAAASALALSACGGDGDDALGQQAEENMENKAENLEAMADNATTDAQEQALEAQAEAVEDMGDKKEEAIDNTDVDADELSESQKNAMTKAE